MTDQPKLPQATILGTAHGLIILPSVPRWTWPQIRKAAKAKGILVSHARGQKSWAQPRYNVRLSNGDYCIALFPCHKRVSQAVRRRVMAVIEQEEAQ